MTEKKKHPGGRPRKYKTPEEMQIKVDEYFRKHRSSPTLAGLSLYLDFADYQSILDYGKKDEFTATISRARRRIIDFLEKKCIREKGTAQGIIHRLKVMKYDAPQQIKHDFTGSFADFIKGLADARSNRPGDIIARRAALTGLSRQSN